MTIHSPLAGPYDDGTRFRTRSIPGRTSQAKVTLLVILNNAICNDCRTARSTVFEQMGVHELTRPERIVPRLSKTAFSRTVLVVRSI